MPDTKASRVPKTAKKPSDHKPKEDEPRNYTFQWDGSAYTLPSPDTAVDKVSGRALRDAYMDGEEGQMRLGFAMLENVDCDQAVLDALYDMPAPMMLDHLQKWMELRVNAEAATVGESLRSLS